MIACYILHSDQLSRYYVGFTQDDIEARLLKHNSGFYDKTYSSIASDWVLFLVIECETVSQALQIEKHIKRMKSVVYIRNLLVYPEIIEKLKIKYL